MNPENKLEESLIKASEDPSHRPQFYKDFVEADVFIIEESSSMRIEGSTTLEKEEELRLLSIDIDGKPYLPIFSSLQRLQSAIEEEVTYLAINSLEFLKMTQGSDIILNPGADFGKEFTETEIISILDGSIWEPSDSYVAKKDTEILLGQPINYPDELVGSLVRLFKKTKEVKSAYLAHYHNPDQDDPPHTLIGLSVSENYREVVAKAGMVAEETKVPDPPIDFIEIEAKSGVTDYFLNECKPFYKKKTFGIF